jgi:hypothetical protein
MTVLLRQLAFRFRRDSAKQATYLRQQLPTRRKLNLAGIAKRKKAAPPSTSTFSQKIPEAWLERGLRI